MKKYDKDSAFIRLAQLVEANVFAQKAYKDICNGIWTQSPNKMGETMHIASMILKESRKIPGITNPVSPDVLA